MSAGQCDQRRIVVKTEVCADSGPGPASGGTLLHTLAQQEPGQDLQLAHQSLDALGTPLPSKNPMSRPAAGTPVSRR